MVEAGIWISSSAIIVMSLLLDMNLTFLCKLEGMAPSICIYRCLKSKLKTAGIFSTTKDISNLYGPIVISDQFPQRLRFWFHKMPEPQRFWF